MRLVFASLLALNATYAAYAFIHSGGLAQRAYPGVLVGNAIQSPSGAARLVLASEKGQRNASSGDSGDSFPYVQLTIAEGLPLHDTGVSLSFRPGSGSLLTEQIAGSKARAPAPFPDEAEPIAMLDTRCVSAGPFATDEAALGALSTLAPFVIRGQVQKETIEGRAVFWVHIPARPSREEGRRVVQALKRRGISSFIIEDEGPLNGSISLGVFHDIGSAERFAAQMGRLEYPVKLARTTPQESSIFYVQATIMDGSRAGIPVALRQLIGQREPAATIEDVPCERIAID